MPHMMSTTVNTAGTSNQVPPVHSNVTSAAYRSRAPLQTKRSKAIKIIDPTTHQEVNVNESKSENPPPLFPDSTGAQVHIQTPPTVVVSTSAPAAPSVAVDVAPNSIKQDFKRMVYERTVTSEGAQVATPNQQKPPPPNAIITDPNKLSGVSNANEAVGVVGVEIPSSEQTVEIETLKQEQQHQPLLPPISAPLMPPTMSGVQPLLPQAHVSELTQEIRDQFYQQVHQTVEVPATTTVTVEKAATQDGKDGDEEEAQVVLSSQDLLETKVEPSAPQPAQAPEPTPQPLMQPVEQPTRQPEAQPVSQPLEKPLSTTESLQTVTQPSVTQPVAQPVSSQPVSSTPGVPTVVSVTPPAPPVDSTTETEVSESEPAVTQNGKEEEKEREENKILDDTSKSNVSSEVGGVAEEQAPAIEAPAIEAPAIKTPTVVPTLPEKASVEKQMEDALPAVPVTVEPTPPEQIDSTSKEEEESSRVAGTDDDSEPPEPQKGEEERASSESVEITEEPPEEDVGLYEEVSESETNEEEGDMMVELQSKETQETVVEPVSGTESTQVHEALSATKSLPVGQLPADSVDSKRTEQPKHIESEIVGEAKTDAVKQQEPSLSSEIKKATEKDEVALEPPKPDKQEEQPPLSTSKVVNPAPPVQPAQPANKGRTSPPVATSSRPKEVVKPVEPVRTEKKSKPPSTRPSDVPATARPVPPSGELLLESTVHVSLTLGQWMFTPYSQLSVVVQKCAL